MSVINKIALGGAALVVLTVGWLFVANARLRAEVAEARANIIACRMANDDFSAVVAKQNKAVEQIKADSENRIRRTKENAQKYLVAAEKIKKTKMHGEACQAADALFNLYLEENK